jgi:hypothetical protein
MNYIAVKFKGQEKKCRDVPASARRGPGRSRTRENKGEEKKGEEKKGEEEKSAASEAAARKLI